MSAKSGGSSTGGGPGHAAAAAAAAAAAGADVTPLAGGFEPLQSEVATTLSRFELARFALVRCASEISDSHTTQMAQAACAALRAMMSFFHAGHDTMQALEPSLDHTQAVLQTKLARYRIETAAWRRQREQLQLELDWCAGALVPMLAL
ncbi:MAG: hypothetical protein ACK4ZJ_15880, partial [Allorhizobium sp.]